MLKDIKSETITNIIYNFSVILLFLFMNNLSLASPAYKESPEASSFTQSLINSGLDWNFVSEFLNPINCSENKVKSLACIWAINRSYDFNIYITPDTRPMFTQEKYSFIRNKLIVNKVVSVNNPNIFFIDISNVNFDERYMKNKKVKFLVDINNKWKIYFKQKTLSFHDWETLFTAFNKKLHQQQSKDAYFAMLHSALSGYLKGTNFDYSNIQSSSIFTSS